MASQAFKIFKDSDKGGKNQLTAMDESDKVFMI